MELTYSVALKALVEEFELEVVYAPEDFDDKLILTEELNRPGLSLTGVYDYFSPDRIQLIGRMEHVYLNKQLPSERKARFERLMSTNFPAMIYCRGLEIYPECLAAAEKYQVAILRTQERTSQFMGDLISSLKSHLAPRITMPGVLVEVYGSGVLLTGESGVGKSETAIELIKRGHRLISDDAVEIKRISSSGLIGSAPELIRHYVELRGIGVIDARKIFGVASVKNAEGIDLVIHLEQWQEGKEYDRLGADSHYTTILGIEVPSVRVPVKPGRNLAVIVEVAAMNQRQRSMGHNAALELTGQLDEYFEKHSPEGWR